MTRKSYYIGLKLIFRKLEKFRKLEFCEFSKFSNVQFNPTSCGLNLISSWLNIISYGFSLSWRELNIISSKLSNQLLKWNFSLLDIYLLSILEHSRRFSWKILSTFKVNEIERGIFLFSAEKLCSIWWPLQEKDHARYSLNNDLFVGFYQCRI